MEIIRAGELPGEKIYEATCSHCKTLFRFKRNEAHLKTSNDQRDPSYLEIMCPFTGCGKLVTKNV